MSGVNWELGRTPDVAGGAMAAFEKGAKMGEELRKRQALASFAEDPNNPETINALLRASPEIGFRAMEHQRKVAQDTRETEGRNAMADYVIANRRPPPPRSQSPQRAPLNALIPIGSPAPTNALQPNAMLTAAQPPAATAMSNGMPGGLEEPTGPAPTSQPTVEPVQGPDYSFLGEPQDDADAAFLRAVRADPKAALTIDSLMRDNFVKYVKAERDTYDFAVSRLAGVSSDEEYQAVLDEVDERLAPIGTSVRQHVPPRFPGADGIKELRLRALDSKDQISAFLRETDMEADNDRADRNTDSVISDRQTRTGVQQGRLEETRRNNERRDTTTRRGQDRRDATTRRGQDQRGARPGSSYTRPIPVKTPADAAKFPKGTHIKTPDGRVLVTK